MTHYENLQLYLRLQLKFKKNTWCNRFQSISKQYVKQWLKQYVEFNTQRRIKAKKNDDKDGKVF